MASSPPAGTSMLTDQQLEEYFTKHNLAAPAREYIQQTRDSEPSRLVGTNASSNVISGFPSTKTNLLIQTESRTAEHAHALEHEYSSTVIEFWDQPPPVNVVRTSPKDKPLPGYYTPDFVVLDVTGPYVEEVKPDEAVEKLLRTRPADWIQTETGVTFRPALEAYGRLGLTFKVVSVKFNPIWTENLKLLLKTRRAPLAANDEIRAAVEAALAEQAWMSLSTLGARVGITDLTPLIQLIDQEFLHVLLLEELLTQPDSTWVARSLALHALRKETNPDQLGYRALDGGELRVSATQIPSGKRASRALANLERWNSGESSRSMRRWKRKIRQKQETGEETKVLAIVMPKWDKCGNPKDRLCETRVKFIKDFIEEHCANPKRLGICAAHKLYKNLAKDAHPLLPPVCRATLKRYIKLANARTIAQGRGGRRAANAAAEPTPVTKRQLLATRPFQMASMDHYETDVHCVLARRDGVPYTARPYLTILIDVEMNFVYSLWLSFRDPSRRACAMAIRLCVRKHGKLPEEIVIDRGPEFESVYFSALLAHCGVGPVWRPAEHPRYGSEAERFFGEFKTQWLSLRQGNLVNYKEARAVSRSHAPGNQAALSIEQLLSELLAFCEWRNTNKVDLSNLSPSERVTKGLQAFSCSGVPVANDQTFLIASAVETKNYALDPSRGLHVGELHYWHPDLRKLAAVGRVKDVRPDPEDPYRVYAKVGTEWITCQASGAQQFGAKDPVLRLAEAIRIHDGRNARLEAKADADQLLITKMRGFDDQWAAEAAQKAHPSPAGVVQATDESIFEKIRNASIDPLKTTTWGKP